MEASQVQAIQWPTANVGGETKTLRRTYTTDCQMLAWGFSAVNKVVPLAAWAAAMMGTFDAAGKWRSTAWDRWTDMTDALLPEEVEPLIAATAEALKKAVPEATITVQPIPAQIEALPN